MRNADYENDDIRRLDPIDGERLAASWPKSEAKRALFHMLNVTQANTATHALASPPRSSRRVPTLAAGLAVAGVAIVLVTGVFQGTTTPAFAIRELPNGVIEIENVADLHDPGALEAELRDFGVNVEISTYPVSPSMVGTAVAGVDGVGDGPVSGLSFGQDGTSEVFRWRIDPKLFRDEIKIQLYVEAHEGEDYYFTEEVFEPGEILGGLQCALAEPLRAGDVAARLPQLGITPVWMVTTQVRPGDPHVSREEQVEAVPEGEVMSGEALNDSTVQFHIVPDGVTLPGFYYRPHLSDVPCSPEQAAPWQAKR